MPSVILDNPFFEFDTVDLSAFVRSLTLTYGAEDIDETSAGDDTRISLGGLKNWSIEVEFEQDFDAGGPDASLFSKVGTTGTVKIREDAGVVGSTNPEYSGTALLTSYPPFGASVGDLQTTSASFSSAGTLSRATA